MSLRTRLAAAFFVLLVGPVAVVAALVYLALEGGPGPDPQGEAVRAVVSATCQRLSSASSALAVTAAAEGESFVATDTAAPQPWAVCGVGPDSVLLPAGSRYGSLAARSPVRDASGTQVGYAYAVQPLDAGLMRQLSDAAGCPVMLIGTGTAPTDSALPLPLSCAGSAPGRTRLSWSAVPVGLAALLVTAGLAWWLASLTVRPLRRLLHAVDRIIAGDLSARTVIGGRDEAAKLGAGLEVLVGGMREAQRLSLTDPLTGLGNVRRLGDSLRLEVERATRFGRCLGLLVLDLDHFKEVNDAHGHRAGDAVLVEFANRVRAAIREVDVVFRQGGEEFVVLLPETDLPGSLTAARRIGEAVRDAPFAVLGRGGEPVLIEVTVSIGVAVYPRHAVTGAELLDAADLAMYRAKGAGRDTFALAAAVGASGAAGESTVAVAPLAPPALGVATVPGEAPGPRGSAGEASSAIPDGASGGTSSPCLSRGR